ncbi:MAG: hypothetical protein ACON4W_07065 [Parvibaculales bacterium]
MKTIWRYIVAIPIVGFLIASKNAFSEYLSDISGLSSNDLATILGFIMVAGLAYAAAKYGE